MAPVSDETPLHRLAASDRQLRDLETKLAATRQAIDSFCDGGLEPPQSLVDSLSSLSRELVDARRISSDLHGAIRPPSQWPRVSSHRQRFAAGPSVSWRQPYAFASGQPTSNSSGHSFRPGGDSSPHKRRRLPVENSSDDERKSSAGLLLPDEGEGDKENCRPASLALLLDYILSKFPAASKPLARPSNRLTDENSSDHGRNSSAGLLQLDEQEGDEENCLPASLALLLDYIMSKFPAASKPLARPSNRLPDENSFDHGRYSSAGLLQPDEEEGDEENCRPASLALLLDYIMSKFPIAPKPLAQPST